MLTTDTNRYSFVVTTATEEWNYGAEGGTAGSDAYIIVAGGETSGSVAAFGLNSWTFIGQFITAEGVTATNNGLLRNATSSTAQTIPFLVATQNTAGEFIWAEAANTATTKPVLNTTTSTNHCWTAVGAMPSAQDATRAVIAGYSGSITTCLKHAVDGYSFWGAILMARVGVDWTADTAFVTANSAAVTT